MDVLEASRSKPLQGGPSFTLRHRLHRVAWNLTWFVLASWTPTFLNPWRRAVLRLFGAKIDATAMVYGSARIWSPSNLEMEAHSCLGPGVICYSMAKIRLGAYSVVSQRANLCAGSHDIEDEDFQLIAKPIAIGERAWVAAEAFVGPGVTVGHGAVLGARGVAFRDLEPWTVYVGNPAEAIKTRKVTNGHG